MRRQTLRLRRADIMRAETSAVPTSADIISWGKKADITGAEDGARKRESASFTITGGAEE